jgi:hypothetical protein
VPIEINMNFCQVSSSSTTLRPCKFVLYHAHRPSNDQDTLWYPISVNKITSLCTHDPALTLILYRISRRGVSRNLLEGKRGGGRDEDEVKQDRVLLPLGNYLFTPALLAFAPTEAVEQA